MAAAWLATALAAARGGDHPASPKITHQRFNAPLEMHLVRFDRAQTALRVLDLAPGHRAACIRATEGAAP